METSVLAFIMALNVQYNTPVSGTVLNSSLTTNYIQPGQLLGMHEMALSNRQSDFYVNGIFRDNILLNIAYLAGKINDTGNIDWDMVRKPFHYEFRLNPDEIFAFHDNISASYKGKFVKTTNAHFSFQEGFKSDGFLVGDGVCHLATLINWVAKDSGLTVEAPTRHDFAPVPGVPLDYGVSIYYYPGENEANSRQNLYIKNDFTLPVVIVFDYTNDILRVSVYRDNNLVYLIK